MGNQFLTDGLQSPFREDEVISRDVYYGTHLKRQQLEVLDGTDVLITQGSYAQATAKTYISGGRAVWIGNDYNYMFNFQDMRTLLRRSLTWTIGYNLYKTWENDIIMIMDDTFKLATLAGFGWCGWEQGYCGTDMVVIGWDFMGTNESLFIVAAPPDAHDYGIVTNPAEFSKIFDQYPMGRFMSINEYICYIHTANSGVWLKEQARLNL